LEITNLDTREWYGQVEPLGQDRLASATARMPSLAETAITFAPPEEMLVADARGRLTPVQMVEQKLLALLGSNYPGLSGPVTGRMGYSGRTLGQ